MRLVRNEGYNTYVLTHLAALMPKTYRCTKSIFEISTFMYPNVHNLIFYTVEAEDDAFAFLTRMSGRLPSSPPPYTRPPRSPPAAYLVYGSEKLIY